MQFGDEWLATDKASFQQDANDTATTDFSDPRDFVPPEKCKWVTPVIAGVVTLLSLIVIVAQAGGTVSQSSPRVVLFVIEGFKATVFEETITHGIRGPNMQALCQQGSYAACLGTSDTRCCRAQTGPKNGPQFSWSAAPGIASILTGVDSPKHQVTNTSFAAMSNFADSSQRYPSIASIATKAGIKVAAFGGSSLLTSIDDTGKCGGYGVLDFECGVLSAQRCTAQQTCNLNRRFSYPTTNGAINQEDMVDDIARVVDDDVGLLIVHLNRLNFAATQKPGGRFESASMPYSAQIYLTDSIVGRVVSMISRTISRRRENWLIMGVSDHGGLVSSYGTNPDDDEVVAFFLSTLTMQGTTLLDFPSQPTTQMDVAPTLLHWLGVFDATATVPTIQFDGRRQAICTDGKSVRNCTRTSVLI